MNCIARILVSAFVLWAASAAAQAPGALPAPTVVGTDAQCGSARESQAFQSGVERIRGNTLAYTEGPKNGPTIIFLPGMAVPRLSYLPSARLLCKQFHVIMIDQRGQGESSWAEDHKYRVVDYGEDIAAFITTHLKGQPVIISGHSLGGLVALWLAAKRPDLVIGLNAEDNPFLMSEAGYWDHHWVKPQFEQLERRLQRAQNSGRDPKVLRRAFAEEQMVLPRQDVPYEQRIRALGKQLSIMTDRGIRAADAAEQARLDKAYQKWLDGKPVTNAEFLPRAALERIPMAGLAVDPLVPHFAVTAELNDGFAHRAAMAQVRAPTLYWNSDQDLVGVISQAEHDENVRVIADHARTHHVIARGVGHLIHAEQPELYAREITSFFLPNGSGGE